MPLTCTATEKQQQIVQFSFYFAIECMTINFFEQPNGGQFWRNLRTWS